LKIVYCIIMSTIPEEGLILMICLSFGQDKL